MLSRERSLSPKVQQGIFCLVWQQPGTYPCCGSAARLQQDWEAQKHQELGRCRAPAKFTSTQPDPAAALPWDGLAERPRSVLHQGPPLHHTPSSLGALRSHEDQLQSDHLPALLSLLCITAGNWPSNPLSLGMALLPSLLSPLESKCSSPAVRAGFIPAIACINRPRAPEISSGSSVFHTSSSSIPHP